MYLGRYVSVTSPAGICGYSDLIGASVKISSTSVGSSVFGYPSDEYYKIEDIKFRLNQNGKCITSIHLEGIDEPFEWKDLEITGLDMTVYCDAICNEVCAGVTLCGWGDDEEDGSSTEDTSCECCCCDGPVLD